MLVAFSALVWTPARSDRGWTRGMPPPNVSATRLRADKWRRPVVHATLSEQRPLKLEYSEEESVNAYVLDGETTIGEHVQAFIKDLEKVDEKVGRKKLVEGGRDQTISVHGGERVRGGKLNMALLDAIQVPIVQSATFTFRSTKDCIEYNRGTYESFEYGRYGNPTTKAAEEKIRALEKAEDCLLSASGMNAVTTMLLALVPEGGHIVTTTDCYRRTRQFMTTVLPKMGIGCTVLDPADMDGLKALLESKRPTIYFSETPTNPMIRIVDIAEIARLCRKHGVISVFDTTFATPVNIRPVELGADLVLHSGTKYLSGHQDVMSGVLAGRGDLVASVRKLHGVLGGVVDPHAAYLILRGMKTLGVRMEAHNRNAASIAKYLSTHPKIAKVNYPTLEKHTDYRVAKKLFHKGFGGMLSFEIRGDGDKWSQETFLAAGRFVDGLRIPYIGPSLGGCESLVEQVCIMGYFDQPLRERKRLGINNGLIRFSCGIEDVNDLIDDIEAALTLA